MNNKFDIIHLVRIFRPNVGGMESIVENIARIQSRTGLRILVITSEYLRESYSLDFNDSLENYDIYRIKSFVLKGIILPSIRNRSFKHLKCSTLHIHGMDPFVDLVSLYLNYDRKILSPHGGFYHTNSLLPLKWLYFNLVSKNLYRGVSAYSISYNDVALSKRLMTKAFYMGCGFNKMLLKEEDFERNSDDNVLIFGRIAPNKNVKGSINFALENFSSPSITVVGHDQIGLSDFYSNHYNVNFKGMIDDSQLRDEFLKAHYFICLSKYEGLGMTVLEALYGGLRCILSNIESFRLIEENLESDLKQHFIYIIGYSTISFEDWKLQSCTSEMRIKISKSIANQFSWENVVKVLEN